MSSADERVQDQDVIIKPYTGDPTSRGHRRARGIVVAMIIGFCFFYGLFWSFFSPYLIMPFLAPLPVLGIIVIWALPDTRTAPIRTLDALLFIFIVGLVMWPNYLALALPGLPWITIVRLTGFPLFAVLLICVSISPDFRARLATALQATPLLWKFMAAFVAIQTISIALSHNPFFSIDKYIIAQISWTGMFFASGYVFLRPGRVERMAAMLWVLAILVGLIALVEYRHSQVPWAGHIPRFLKIEDEAVLRALQGQRRAADGIYRLQSTFSNSLGLAEYLALTMPFVLQFAFGSYRWTVRLAAAASVPFLMFIVIHSGSRLGMIGCLMSFLLYAGIWALLRWRRDKESLFGPLISLGYPVIFALTLAATFAIGRLRALVWGDGPQQASNEGRKIQLHMGLPKIFSHPWGYGEAMGGDALGYRTPAGILTIDSYYLSIALEYGVIGFVVFYGILALGMFYGYKGVMTGSRRWREQAFLIPLSIAIANFLVIKSVFSQQDNHALIFMMLGMIVALCSRVKQDGDAAAAS
jgi:hypothetical protein